MMQPIKAWRFLLCLVMMFALGLTVSAQNPISGTLASGQPVSADLPTGGALFFEYVLVNTSQVSFQAISASVKSGLTVLRNGQPVASQPNATGELTVSLDALLTAGVYQVRVEALNATSGTVIVLVQSETPVLITDIGLDTLASELLDDQVPLALYRFKDLPEAAYLYITSELPQGGLSAVLSEETTGAMVGSLGSAATGVRFTLPASSLSYTIQVSRARGVAAVKFTLCLTAVSTGGCESGGNTGGGENVVTPPAGATPVATVVDASACMVAPTNSGGANIRQSASTGSIIVGALPGNAFANVLGQSPDKSFFNIQYNAINGWVAESVVVTSGACDSLATIQPPAIIAPTSTPTPTPIPPTATPAGPCLLNITAPTNTYTTTIADASNLFDQIQSGTVEAIGRTSDNQWWQTNYGDSWIQTNTFGNTVFTSGGCHNLPVVSP